MAALCPGQPEPVGRPRLCPRAHLRQRRPPGRFSRPGRPAARAPTGSLIAEVGCWGGQTAHAFIWTVRQPQDYALPLRPVGNMLRAGAESRFPGSPADFPRGHERCWAKPSRAAIAGVPSMKLVIAIIKPFKLDEV